MSFCAGLAENPVLLSARQVTEAGPVINQFRLQQCVQVFTAPILLTVSGSAGMLLLGTDTEHAGSAVAASDPVQKLALILAALTTVAGLMGLFRALFRVFRAHPVAVTESRPCEACDHDAPGSALTSSESSCSLCGSVRSRSL